MNQIAIRTKAFAKTVTFLAMRGVTVPVQQNLRPRGRLGSLVGLQYLE
jgi:hypothetical protein